MKTLTRVNQLPLAGITIIDMSSAVAGPMGTMLLSDDGAEVVKVEPIEGDLSRTFPPFIDGVSLYFASTNRNKRSIGLDIKSKEGRKILDKLISTADAIVVNMPSLSKMKQIGLDIESLEKINPNIIEIAISLEGHTGPKMERKGYDLLVQASLSMHMTGPKNDNHPNRYPGPLVDVLTAQNVHAAFYKALRVRDSQTQPKSQFIDISLRESLGITMFAHLAQAATLDKDVPREGDGYLSIVPYTTLPTKSGYLSLAVGSQNNWRSFCRLIIDNSLYSHNLSQDKRFSTNQLRGENREDLYQIIGTILLQKTATEWERLFTINKIPAEAVKTVLDFVKDPQTISRKVMLNLEKSNGTRLKVVNNPLAASGLPIKSIASFPPDLGQHTDTILSELGFSEDQIIRLREGKTVI